MPSGEVGRDVPILAIGVPENATCRDLAAAFAAVAAIGSTSGTDTLTGVVDTLDALTPPTQGARP